ncbi:MAG: ATP-binding cassette domain-containing protein [Clostridia bacterium]|nr:ATP-binding cassette domain-containing protein [Clostridia bacterium]
MLRVVKLCKSYEHAVLSDFSYDFPDRGLFLLKGESGRGKTTLLRLLAGLERPDRGEILRAEDAVISAVFQEARLVPHLSLLDNLLLVSKKKDKRRAMEILTRLRLAEAAHKKPPALSGGMKQRGAIARSIYYGGSIYLWDEPTGELDPENRRIVWEYAAQLAENALVICVTHDRDLRDGTVIELK